MVCLVVGLDVGLSLLPFEGYPRQGTSINYYLQKGIGSLRTDKQRNVTIGVIDTPVTRLLCTCKTFSLEVVIKFYESKFYEQMIVFLNIET